MIHWVLGSMLALAWLSRIIGAIRGMPSISNVTHDRWDLDPVTPAGNPRASTAPRAL